MQVKLSDVNKTKKVQTKTVILFTSAPSFEDYLRHVSFQSVNVCNTLFRHWCPI